MEVKVYDEVDKNAANVKIYATVKARGRAEMWYFIILILTLEHVIVCSHRKF